MKHGFQKTVAGIFAVAIVASSIPFAPYKTLLDGISISASAGDTNKYLVYDETRKAFVSKEIDMNITASVDSSGTVWGSEGSASFYLVDGEVTIADRITVKGDVTLILKDHCKLTASKGIEVSQNNSLTICGQNVGFGQGILIAEGETNCAGIGGNEHGKNGDVTINGGMVEATGGNNGAGIGSGGNADAGGTVTINGGDVTATGGGDGAGIGSGNNSDCGTVIINDGMVTATGTNFGAGIGSGGYRDGGTVIINGGTVNATSTKFGAGIGGGCQGAGGSVTINSGMVTAKGMELGAGIGGGFGGAGGNVTIDGGTVNAISLNGGASIGHGSNCTNNGTLTLRDSAAVFDADNKPLTLPEGKKWIDVVSAQSQVTLKVPLINMWLKDELSAWTYANKGKTIKITGSGDEKKVTWNAECNLNHFKENELDGVEQIFVNDTLVYTDGFYIYPTEKGTVLNCTAENVTLEKDGIWVDLLTAESDNLILGDHITSVDKNAFYKWNTLKSVSMPNVTLINDGAFYSCASLEAVSMPNVTSLGISAFYECSSLVSVDMPNVTSLKEGAFYECASLKSVDMPKLEAVGSGTFLGCESLESISIPNVTVIGVGGFYNCRNLASVQMPSVTAIEENAFLECPALKSIQLCCAEKPINLEKNLGTALTVYYPELKWGVQESTAKITYIAYDMLDLTEENVADASGTLALKEAISADVKKVILPDAVKSISAGILAEGTEVEITSTQKLEAKSGDTSLAKATLSADGTAYVLRFSVGKDAVTIEHAHNYVFNSVDSEGSALDQLMGYCQDETDKIEKYVALAELTVSNADTAKSDIVYGDAYDVSLKDLIDADGFDVETCCKGQLISYFDEKGVSISKPTDAGQYVIRAIFTINNKQFYLQKEFEIKPLDLNADEVNASFTISDGIIYDGEEQQASVAKASAAVAGKEVSLTEKDYFIENSDLSAAKATDAGKYHILIKGQGNFCGTVEADWAIEQAAVKGIRFVVDNKTYDGEEAVGYYVNDENETIELGGAFTETGKALYKKDKAGNYQPLLNGKPIDAGDYKYVITLLPSDKNYAAAELTAEFSIAKAAATINLTDIDDENKKISVPFGSKVHDKIAFTVDGALEKDADVFNASLFAVADYDGSKPLDVYKDGSIANYAISLDDTAEPLNYDITLEAEDAGAYIEILPMHIMKTVVNQLYVDPSVKGNITLTAQTDFDTYTFIEGKDYTLTGSAEALKNGEYTVQITAEKGNLTGKFKLTWDVDTEKFADRTYKHSVSLTNDLAVNFYVSANGIAETDDFALEVLNRRTNKIEMLTGKPETVAGVQMYKFSYKGIAAANAGDIVAATPVIKLEDGTEYRYNSDEYSVAEYCYTAIENAESAKLKTLAVDLLNFCAAVQTYAKSTEPLVNADLTPEQQALGTQGELSLNSVENAETLEGAAASFTAKTLVVGNNISLRYYVDLSNVENVENVTITLNYAGKEKTFTSADFGKGRTAGEYTITYSELPVSAFSEPIEAVVYENGKAISGKFTYSVASYADAVLKKSANESMKKVADTMMRYAASATAYK